MPHAGYTPSYYSGDSTGYYSPSYNYYGGNSFAQNPGSYGYDTGGSYNNNNSELRPVAFPAHHCAANTVSCIAYVFLRAASSLPATC